MSNPDDVSRYPISTRELMAIAARELGKKLPVLGEIISAHDAVMQKVEAARLQHFLQSLEQRIFALEKSVLKSADGQVVLLITADAVRTDVRANKTQFYADVVVSFAKSRISLDESVDVLEAVRRVSAEDLQMLLRFSSGEGHSVAGLSGLIMSSMTDETVPANVQAVMPQLHRLQGMGLITIFPAKSQPNSGFFNARLDAMVRQEVALSALGKTVCRALAQRGD